MSVTQPQPVLPALAGNWWAFLARGIAAVLFGLAVFFWPRETPFDLLVFFGSYALVDGILALVAGLRGSGDSRWLLLVEGVIGVVAGLIAFLWPGETVLVLPYVIAAWAIFTGILKVVMAIWLRRERDASFLMGFSGGLSMLLGVLMAAQDLPGAAMETWALLLIIIYAPIFGIALITLGVRVRSHRQGSGRA
jgi:uncharacterized membrane protein HdeD (DUF308 family)